MFFLIGTCPGTMKRRLAACLLCALASACVDTERVPFEIRLADQGCKNTHTLDRIELFLLPIEPDGRLCRLSQKTVPADQRSATTLETGAIDVEEIVALALAYGVGAKNCVECYALARVPLRTALTRYNLTLAPTADCAVPAAALQGFGLPPDPVPPSRPCP